MNDIEKSRVAYVQQLETKLAHLQNEYEKHKAIADKWEPRVTVKTDTETGKVTFGLQFGGKYVHATVSQNYLAQMDTTTATSEICDALVESLVVSELRKIFAPEIERMSRGAFSVTNAGKW